jgi:hypothetical protein
MQFSRVLVLLAVACVFHPVPTFAQAATPSTIQQLIKDVSYNELQDHERDNFWQYRMHQQLGSQRFVKYQVETQHGPIFRILEKDGHPLTRQEERNEETRLTVLLNNPGALAKNRDSHLQDEERVHRLINFLPEAFLYEPVAPPSGDLLTLKFRPNPDFKPSTYEARVFHGLAGTMVVNARLKRFVSMRGTVTDRVDFGFGLLGYIDKGGQFEIHREQLTDTHWKTDFVNVHVSGRVILFKSIAKDHYEARTQFQPVRTSISLPEARRLLEQAALQNEATLQTAQRF